MDTPVALLRVLALAAGVLLAGYVIRSAIRTLLLPRIAQDRIVRVVFRSIRRVLAWFTGPSRPYAARDRILAFYAPLSLFSLPFVWLTLALIAYSLIYWGLGVEPFWEAVRESGSALLTLGFAMPPNEIPTLIVFSEAMLGPILIALLISYLPTMYAAFQKREVLVTLLEVRAGSPPSPVDMVIRYFRIRGIESMSEIWTTWEVWFAELDESHTSLPALTFFRSPRPDRSWITAAGAVLDAASLRDAVIDLPRDPFSNLCIRSGYLALRHICDFFLIPYNADPTPDDPISISRAEFDEAYRALKEEGVPVKADQDAAWRDFSGWRVNYDDVLLRLCALTVAPRAPWSSDRAGAWRMPPAKAQPRRKD